MSSESDKELALIENGLYTLRASPVAGVGGLYATGNGISKIVTVAAQVPKTFSRQTVSSRIFHLFFIKKC